MNRFASPAQARASIVRWSLFIVPTVVLLGFLSAEIGGDASSPWFRSLAKPATFPPPAAFGIVWSILYVLMGLAFAMVCAAWGKRGRGWAIAAFLVQFALNLAWSPLFFGAHRITAALYLLAAIDVAVIVTIALFWRARRAAALLMLPYLAWILFATVLNWQFLQLNPDADGAAVSGSVQRIEL